MLGGTSCFGTMQSRHTRRCGPSRSTTTTGNSMAKTKSVLRVENGEYTWWNIETDFKDVDHAARRQIPSLSCSAMQIRIPVFVWFAYMQSKPAHYVIVQHPKEISYSTLFVSGIESRNSNGRKLASSPDSRTEQQINP